MLAREAAVLGDAVDRVRGAHAANDVERWTEARGRLDGALVQVGRAREQARARAGDAAPEAAGRLADVEGRVAELAAAARGLTEPPTGIARLAREGQLEAALAAPIAGSVAAGYARKEAAVRAEFDRLSAAESRVLAERLRRARPNDPLASLFGRMTADRRDRLLAHLDGARRREAIRVARTPRMPPSASATGGTGIAAGSASSEHRAAPTAAAGPAPAPGATATAAGAAVVRAPAPVSADLAVKAPPIRSVFDAAARVRKLAKPDVAPAYLRANHDRFVEAMRQRLSAFAPPAQDGLAWVSGGVTAAFADALVGALDGDRLFARLPELLHPIDPWYVIDQHRELVEGRPGVIVDGRDPTGPLFWSPTAGQALATEIAGRLREAFARMAPRYAVQLDEKQAGLVMVADLVTSHPMDRVAARLLCDERVVKPVARRRGAAPVPSGDRTLFREGLRFVEDWQPLGERDLTLWNWIEVRSPRDATAEEVAASLFHAPVEAPSHLAYSITAAAPFFRIEPGLARGVPGLLERAPKQVDRPNREDALALAESAFATEAAIAQAADERRHDKRGLPLPPSLEGLTKLLESSARKLERAKELLVPWRLWSLVLPAIHWVGKHREHLLNLPDERLVALTPVIEGQHALLFEAVGELLEVLATATRAPDAASEAGPIADVLRGYGVAIGESHLLDTARAHLARTRGARERMTLALLDRSLHESRDAVRELAASETRDMHYGGAAAAENHAAYQRQVLELRDRQAAGGAVDPGDVEVLAANLKEHLLDTKVKSLYLQLHTLQEEARDSLFGGIEVFTAALHGDVASLPPKLGELIRDLQETVIAGWASEKAMRLRELGGAPDPRARAWAANRACEAAQRELDAFVARHRLAEMIESALRSIERQRTTTAIVSTVVQIALLIGVSVVANFAGSMVAGAVRGALLADAAVSSLGVARVARVAQVVGRVAGLAADAAVNAAGQTVIAGGSTGDAWIDNFLASGAVLVALRPLHAAAASWAPIELKGLSLWARTGVRAGLALRAGAVLTAEMITGAAVGYLVKRARGKAPDERTATTWLIEGASMAIGKFCSLKLQHHEQRLVALVEHGAHLRVRAARMSKIAERVERTGDEDAAMELMTEHHKLLADEADVLANLGKQPGSKITPETLRTLRAGNDAERAALRDKSFATMPLRLAGLSPDDSSGKTWAGATEDIAIALHQASRAGLEVKVLDHDAAARQWRVRYNDEELTIVETRLSGRPRAAKEPATGGDQAHALRYAEAADFMQAQWEAKTKADLDARPVVDFDHLQVGHSIAGVVNQATLPASGEALGGKLVVYEHAGTLAGRGKQELGQEPGKWNAPGLRGSEQAPRDAAWITSEAHKRSLDIGRLEVQTPAYRGAAVALERRPAGPLPEDWKAPQRALRIKVRDAAGAERWFYADRLDNAGGMGPADLTQVKRVVDPQQLDAMFATNQILRGEDPDYGSKVSAGEVFVWGGTRTGAWGAEPAARAPGSDATVMGDTRPPTRDWPRLIEEYEALTRAIALHPGDRAPADLVQRKQQLEAQIAQAHGGMALRRNRKPGATYEHGIRGGDGVRIAFGTPSKISPARDGRVLVTVGTGADAKSTLYDQVVIAHGQDPGAPGAPGALLGRGGQATGIGADGKATYGEVPEGTIALRPIFGPAKDGREPDVLGLESVEPAGIRLIGAAFATRRMSPWVKQSERGRFERALEQMEAEHAPTRDHGPVGDDSTKVLQGIEHQRDKIPRANEVLAAKAYRLPGPEHTLELDRATPAKWDEQVREFFAIHLRANGQWVRVQRVGGGRSRAVVYRVWVDDNDVGVFKLFDGKGGAANEQKMLERLQDAKLTKMTAVKERGRMSIDPKSGLEGGALLMDAAKGKSIRELIEGMPSDPAARTAAMRQLNFAMKRAAEGLAEMHAKFETVGQGGAPKMMSRESKLSDARHLLDNNFRDGLDVPKVKAALGDADFGRVKAALEGPTLQAFLDADVPATAYHGDANAGNFIVHDYHKNTGFKDLGVIDVGSMKWSVDDNTGKGIKTGAADVARLLGSLETLHPGKLTTAEVRDLREEFMAKYVEQYRIQSHRDMDLTRHQQAEKWYRLEMEIAVLKSDARAKSRIMQLLGLEVAP